MYNLNINLFDGTYKGPVIMSSSQSKVIAVRVSKEKISEVSSTLDGPGVYFLLVGTDDVYVGQSNDSVGKRILNTHTGTIDASWHTVVGFIFSGGVSTDELLYMENAMCEYIYKQYGKCLTSNPAKSKCNANYRNNHYSLTIWLKNACKQYVADMEFYLTHFQPMFPDGTAKTSTEITGTKLFLRSTDGADATAVLTQDEKVIVLKGSVISVNTTPSCPASILKSRNDLITDGTIVNRVFQKNWPASSLSKASSIVLGRSSTGRAMWKNADGVTAGELLGDKK